MCCLDFFNISSCSHHKIISFRTWSSARRFFYNFKTQCEPATFCGWNKRSFIGSTWAHDHVMSANLSLRKFPMSPSWPLIVNKWCTNFDLCSPIMSKLLQRCGDKVLQCRPHFILYRNACLGNQALQSRCCSAVRSGGNPTVRPQWLNDQPRGEGGEREGACSLFSVVRQFKASPHCRGNHSVRLTGVAKAIRQRA